MEVGQYVHIRLPDIDDQLAFTVEGLVMWCNQMDDYYEVGVKFRESDEAYYAGLFKKISQVESFKEVIRQREGRELHGEEAVQEYLDYLSKHNN